MRRCCVAPSRLDRRNVDLLRRIDRGCWFAASNEIDVDRKAKRRVSASARRSLLIHCSNRHTRPKCRNSLVAISCAWRTRSASTPPNLRARWHTRCIPPFDQMQACASSARRMNAAMSASYDRSRSVIIINRLGDRDEEKHPRLLVIIKFASFSGANLRCFPSFVFFRECLADN